MGNIKGKTLCKSGKKKILGENWEDYVKLVKSPQYICQSCGRAARKKKNLCEPVEI